MCGYMHDATPSGHCFQDWGEFETEEQAIEMWNKRIGEGEGMRFLVHKNSGDADVLLLSHKGSNKYSFVNLTKGHICSCVFDSIEDAIEDMEARKKAGLLDSYEEIKES